MAYKQSPGRMNMPKTGRGLDAPTLMKGSPLHKFCNFLLKKMTKVRKKMKKLVVTYPRGKETVFSDLGKAKASLMAKLQKAWSDTPACWRS